MVENFGDAPFYPDDVPTVTVAAMTRCIAAVNEVGLPVGVNVLRNDGLAAMTIAAVTGAAFMRVNVLSGTMFTDQGVIEGRAAELARLRASIGPDVEGDGRRIRETCHTAGWPNDHRRRHRPVGAFGSRRGHRLGNRYGQRSKHRRRRHVRQAIPDAPLYLGSGVAEHNVQAFLNAATGVIVGTSIKTGGTTSPRRP